MILTAASRHWMQISVDACIPCLPNSSCSVIGMSFNQDFTHVRLLQTKVWHLMILISVYRFFTPCSWPCLWTEQVDTAWSHYTGRNCPWKLHSLPCQIAWAQGSGTSVKKAATSCQTLHNFMSFNLLGQIWSDRFRSMLRTTESKSLGCLNKYGPKYDPFSTSRVPRSCLFPRTSCELGPPNA